MDGFLLVFSDIKNYKIRGRNEDRNKTQAVDVDCFVSVTA
jgi:hypothetical protein